MKETDFIKNNEQKWKKFEALYTQQKKDPELLTDLFVEITNDLSYAKTNYEKRTVRVYLNQLAQKVFSAFYLKKKNPTKFLAFWKTTLPLEMYRSRFNVLTAFVIFIVAALIGLISQEFDPNFFRVIAGDQYVSNTINSIKNNDPLNIYGTNGEAFTFLTILMNNMKVAFFTFVAGIFFSVGTYFILLYNGIMVGSFQWFFKTHGVLLASFLGIWIHGAFEISAIILAGGAGITLGNGLLFPGTISRGESLKRSGISGLRIMLGIAPLVLLAAFFEGYLTRHYNAIPDIIKLLFIVLCFAIVIFYYIIYPYIVAKRNPEEIYTQNDIPLSNKWSIDKNKIRTSSEIIVTSFSAYGNLFKKYCKKAFLIIFPIMTMSLLYIFSFDSQYYNFDITWYENIAPLLSTSAYFSAVNFFLSSISITIAALIVSYYYQTPSKIKLFSFIGKRILPLYLFTVVFYAYFTLVPIGGMVLLFFGLPFLLGPISSILSVEEYSKNTISLGFKASSKNYMKYLGIVLLSLLITVVFFQILVGIEIEGASMPDVLDSLIVELVRMHTATFIEDYWIVIQFVKGLFYILFLILMIPLWSFSLMFLFYSYRESTEAIGLREEMKQFGKRNDFYEHPDDFE